MASRTKTPPPANRTERRSHGKKRKTPLALIVVPIALIAAAAVLFLTLTGGGKTIIDKLGGEEPVPSFDLKMSKVSAVGTAEDADASTLQTKAEAAARATMPVLDRLFTEAFLDPNNWKDGSYDEAFQEFSDAAASPASTGDLATITLGADAGDTYSKVSPNKGSIRFEVLFDPDGDAFSVAAHVRFYALAERTDGGYTAIVSHGVMFLRDQGGGWKVVGYDMKRNDHETEAPSASASGAPSGASGASVTGAS